MLRFALTGIENITPHSSQRFWFNSGGSIIYAALTNNNFENGVCPVWLYRICISTQSIQEIGRIDLPWICPAMAFDGEEKICFLSVYLLNNNDHWRQRLVIFKVKEGIFKSYERIGPFQDRPYRFLSLWKGDIFIGDVIAAPYNTSVVYKVSALDEINMTFDLSEVCKLAPFGDYPAVQLCVRIVGDGAVRSWYDQPGRIEYCNFYEPWQRFDFAVITPNAEPFEFLYSIYHGGDYKIEFGRSDHVRIFRVLKGKGRQPWEVVFSGPVPDAATTDYFGHFRHAYSPNGRQMAFFAIENSTLLVTIIHGPPCSLVEQCISVLWTQIGRSNPELTNHKICPRLNAVLVGLGKVYYLR